MGASSTCRVELVGLGTLCGRPKDPKSAGGHCTFHSEVLGEQRGRNTRKVVAAGDEAMVRPGVLAAPGHPLCQCGCGEPVYARKMCYGCYHREYRRRRSEQGNPLVRASRGAR